MRVEIKHCIDITNSTCLRGIRLKTPDVSPKRIFEKSPLEWLVGMLKACVMVLPN